MRILIAGFCGFIGHHVFQRLVDSGEHFLIGVDNLSTGKEKWLTHFKNHAEIVYYQDALDVPNEAYRNVDVIINCAAEPRMQHVKEHPEQTLRANTQLVARLAQYAKLFGTKLVHLSSSSVYGYRHNIPYEHGIIEDELLSPANTYGYQKALGESIINDLQPDAVVLRPFNVYGPGQPDDSPYTGVITKFIKQRKAGEPLTIYGDGEQTRDFTFVHDVVDGIIKSVDYLSSNRGVHIYNVGGGKPVSVNQLARACYPSDDAFTAGVSYLPQREGDVKATKASIEKIKTELDWSPSETTPQDFIKRELDV